jgi:hypothetical protein
MEKKMANINEAKEHCCEEASLYSREFYIPCNAPATQVLLSDRETATYRMCEPCAAHNLRRGLTLVGPYTSGGK